ICWLTVTLLTRPVAMDRLRAFHARVGPGGIWGPVAAGRPAATGTGLAWGTLRPWAAGVAMTYGLTFGLGKALLGDWTAALVLLGMAVAGGAVVARELVRG
ncbi:hypothetical protein KKG45_06820, partial [bacterium]|nr:hypothetical protein [bacterium]